MTVLWVSEGNCLKGVWKVPGGCLEGIYGMPKWYAGCLEVSEGQVRTSEVRIGQVRTSQYFGAAAF